MEERKVHSEAAWQKNYRSQTSGVHCQTQRQQLYMPGLGLITLSAPHCLSLAASPMDMDCQTLRHTSATAFAGLILKLNSHNSSLRRTGVHSMLADNPNFRTVCSIRLHTAASTVVSGAHIPILAFSSVLCESLRRRLYGTTLTQAPLCGKSDSEAV